MKSEAIILAGGFGTRLKSVVDDVPKPMAMIGNKPFLTYILDQLQVSNCKKAVMAVGYKHEAIIDYFGKSYKSIALEYSIEDKPLGTGGAILNAANLISSPNFLVLNGDSYFNIDLSDFERQFSKNKAPLLIALKRMSNFDRYGTVEIDGSRIKSFSEKKLCNNGLINSGIYLISKEWYKSYAPGKIFSFEKDILEKYFLEDVLTAHEYYGYFIDIGIPDDYRKAVMEMGKKDNRQK